MKMILFAVLIGVLAAFPALAQDAVSADALPWWANVIAGAAGIIIAVRMLRWLHDYWTFLPSLTDGTPRAKRLTQLAVLAFGLVFGAVGWAGTVNDSRLFAGFLASGVAYFGAGVLGSKLRLEGE